MRIRILGSGLRSGGPQSKKGRPGGHSTVVEVGLIRAPIQLFDDVIEGSVRVFTQNAGVRAAYRPVLENLTAAWRRVTPGGRKRLQKLLDAFPDDAAKLLNTPISDVTISNEFINFLDLANRSQEFFIRRSRFDARLSAELGKRGISAEQLFAGGFKALGPVEQKSVTRAVQFAVDDALQFTFAAAPKRKLGKQVLGFYEKVPLTILAHPFPRFLMNSLDFMYRHSPAGFSRFITKAQREALLGVGQSAEKALAEAVTGTLMLGAGVAVRHSELAGEKWYQVKVGGRVIDTRPFNPLAAYMFFADAVAKVGENGLAAYLEDRQSLNGAAEALAGIRRFRNSGLLIVSGLGEARNGKDLLDRVGRAAGDFLGGFMVPLAQLRDFMAQNVPEEAVFRSTREPIKLPLLGETTVLSRAISNVPGLSRVLPPGARATREGAIGEAEPPGQVGPVPVAPATLRQA